MSGFIWVSLASLVFARVPSSGGSRSRRQNVPFSISVFNHFRETWIERREHEDRCVIEKKIRQKSAVAASWLCCFELHCFVRARAAHVPRRWKPLNRGGPQKSGREVAGRPRGRLPPNVVTPSRRMTLSTSTGSVVIHRRPNRNLNFWWGTQAQRNSKKCARRPCTCKRNKRHSY